MSCSSREPLFMSAPPSPLSRPTCIPLGWETRSCDMSSWMYGRLSYGSGQWSACLFIHFLTDPSNRSTSCLFSMTVSSRQEITFRYFSHQSSGPSLCRALFLPLITTCPSATDFILASHLQQATFTQLHLIPSLLSSTQRFKDLMMSLDPTPALVMGGDFIFLFYGDTSAADL